MPVFLGSRVLQAIHSNLSSYPSWLGPVGNGVGRHCHRCRQYRCRCRASAGYSLRSAVPQEQQPWCVL